MMEYIPTENEQTFPVKPIGVKYICPSCRNGQMVAYSPVFIRTGINGELAIKHYCDNCGAQLDLPKQYPCVEYVPLEKGDESK